MTYKPHKMLSRKDIEFQVKRYEQLLLTAEAEPSTNFVAKELKKAHFRGMIEAYKNVLG
jgi:hypothetical protein